MTPDEHKDKILESANTYLQLGKLLKAKRTSWAKQEVEQILSRHISDEEKIQEIIKIDQASAKQKEILQRKKNKLKDQQVEKKTVKPVESPPKKLHKENFLMYLLVHYRKIAKFGHETQTLKANYLNFSFQVNTRVGVTLYNIQTSIHKLLDSLQWLKENAWQVLSKEEYNLIIAFYDFCDQYYKEFLQNFDYTDLVLVQKQFFIITQKDSYKDMLLSAIKKGLQANPGYASKIEEIIQEIRKIVYENEMTPSLTHIIQALHMQDLKRYCRVKDIIYTEEPPALKKNRYNAPDRVMKKINQHLWNKQTYFLAKKNELQLLDFITGKIYYQNQPSYRILKQFSPLFIGNQQEDQQAAVDFLKEKEDLAGFTLGLLKEYSRVFKQFTTEKVPIIVADGKIVEEKITPYALDEKFRSIQEMYRFLSDTMKKIAFGKIHYNRFQEYIDKKITVSENEKTLFLTIEDLSRFFYELATQLFKNYNYEKEINSLPNHERIKILDDLDIFEKTVPYSKGKINLNYLLSNKTVLEGYIDLLEVCLSFAMLFLNQDLIKRLKYKTKLQEEVNDLTQLMLRMK